MGWGKKTSDSSTYQAVLTGTQLSMIPNDKCEQFLQVSENEAGDLNLGPDFRLHDSFNYAGYVDIFGIVV